MTSPRSLASLPDIVLREVLAYLLVDTPRAPHRTAVLLACSTLHDLGLPLLYKVVDLLGSFNNRLNRHADALFGRSGLLTAGGRIPGLAQSVVELRVGGSRLESGHVMGFDFVLGTVDLPRCTRLVIDCHTPLSSPLRSILPDLPIVDLAFRCDPKDSYSPPFRLGVRTPLASHLGMSVQPWNDLDRITYQGALLWDQKSTFTDMSFRTHYELPLAEWSFKTLVFDLAEWTERMTRALIAPIGSEGKPYFDQVRKIELRVDANMERRFRSDVGKAQRDKPVDVVRERILPLVVFVGPDGEERKLIE